MSGRFITFEGGEGSGKSTQIKLLSEYLKAKNKTVVLTREPGGTPVGQELRRLLVTGAADKFDATAEALLYYADRRIHLQQKIWPALAEGAWVLSDRFADSTMAYQAYGHNNRVTPQMLNELYRLVAGDFRPDLTLIFDLHPEIGLKRSLARAAVETVKEVRFENIDIEFHHRLRRGFLEIAGQDPERCVVLNADQPIDKLHQDVIKVVTERLKI